MSDWPYEEIDDHVERALSRLTSQYDEAERLQALLTVDSERIQDLEAAVYALLTERWLPDAEGSQLGRLGAIVGEPRLGRNDSDYRDAILLRISLNRGGGQPELILTYARVLFGTDDVRLDELYPAKLEIFVNADVTEDQAALIRRIVGAGIGSIFIIGGDGETPFGFSELDQPTTADIAGFGELQAYMLATDDGVLELDGDSALSVNDNEEPAGVEGGGPLGELTEV